MDRDEALSVLAQHLGSWRGRSYRELIATIGTQEVLEVRGLSGTVYQLEVEAFWDDKPGGNVRVIGAVDDEGIRAFAPLTDDFIKAPDGSFVGE